MGRFEPISWFIIKRGNECIDVTIDSSHPNVFHIDKDADTILIQINPECYELRKGRWHIANIVFCNGHRVYGWRFIPRTKKFHASRRLHPNPEAAVAGRGLIIKAVLQNTSHGKTA